MPRVGIRGWSSRLPPAIIPDDLIELLREPTQMGQVELVDALEREILIEAYFDLGEDEAAREFVRQLKSYGLFSHLYPEGESPQEREREREKRKQITIWAVPIAFILLLLALEELWIGVMFLAIAAVGGGIAFFLRRAG